MPNKERKTRNGDCKLKNTQWTMVNDGGHKGVKDLFI